MNLTILPKVIVILVVSHYTVFGQSPFFNLDFESASLATVPSGQHGGLVPFTSALPGWTGYLGDVQATTALHNYFTTGSPSIDILGPVAWNYNPFGPSSIEGHYAVMLQAGTRGSSLINTSIGQTGLVPDTARILLFKAFAHNYAGRPFSVSLGGQQLSVFDLGPATNSSTLYGADISSFAGQVAELKFTAYSEIPGDDFLTLDSIAFSSVPEPSVLSLAAIAGLVFGFGQCRKLRRL